MGFTPPYCNPTKHPPNIVVPSDKTGGTFFMQNITFNDLPEAVAQLFNKLEQIERILSEVRNAPAPTEADELLTVQAAAQFLQLSVTTVYGLISKGELPVMKRSKRCYFSKAELVDYLKKGRKKTNEEIEREAIAYSSEKRKGGRL